jgi:hypothetical protein
MLKITSMIVLLLLFKIKESFQDSILSSKISTKIKAFLHLQSFIAKMSSTVTIAVLALAPHEAQYLIETSLTAVALHKEPSR